MRLYRLLRAFILLVIAGALARQLLTSWSSRKLYRLPLPPNRNMSWTMDVRILIRPAKLPTTDEALVCVTSSPDNIHKRGGIRITWAATPRIKVLFIVGVPVGDDAERRQAQIQYESLQYDDIVQIDLNEHYRNLTRKTVALIMWSRHIRWPRRQVVIKADDDTCINAPLLLLGLHYFKAGMMYGAYRYNHSVLRSCSTPICNKWILTTDEFAPDVFPPHLQGNFYVITEDALDRLYRRLFEPSHLFIEDVYLTGLVAERAGVPRLGMPSPIEINTWIPIGNQYLRRNMLAQHYCTQTMQIVFWRYQMRQSAMFDWLKEMRWPVAMPATNSGGGVSFQTQRVGEQA